MILLDKHNNWTFQFSLLFLFFSLFSNSCKKNISQPDINQNENIDSKVKVRITRTSSPNNPFKFRNLPDKSIGIWINENIKPSYENLRSVYGFSLILCTNWNLEIAESAGFPEDSIYYIINPNSNYQTMLNDLSASKYFGHSYMLDESLDYPDNFYLPTPVQVSDLAHYIQLAKKSNLYLTSCELFEIVGMRYSFVLNSNQNAFIANNKFGSYFNNYLEQFHNYYKKNTEIWVHAIENINQFNSIFKWANIKNLRKIWLYADLQEIESVIYEFCFYAWKNNWLRGFDSSNNEIFP
jgi:hypothetical protein